MSGQNAAIEEATKHERVRRVLEERLREWERFDPSNYDAIKTLRNALRRMEFEQRTTMHKCK